jgi:hypothetical protein
MKCSSCGTESSGNFCPSCGASLRAGRCAECGAELVAGARYCTRCGAAAGATGARSGPATSGNPNLPWYIAGGVLLLLIIILVVPMLRDDGARTSALGPAVPAGAAPGTPPPLTGTPREQADRLFNRIMTAAESGDSAEALRFTPMAIGAYEMAAPLDHDGRYHLAVVHMVAGDYAAARATAEEILATDVNHLLGLAAAGEAAERAGDLAAARDYYGRLLAAYDAEVARGLQEYRDHAQSLPQFRAAAQRITGA